MRTYVLVGGLLCAVIAIPVAYFMGRGELSSSPTTVVEPDEATEARQVPSTVYAEGRLLPAGGMLEIAMLPGEQLLELLVAPGDDVEPEQHLAKTSREPLAELQWRLAEASRDEALQQLNQQKAKAQAERVQAVAALERLKVEYSAFELDGDELTVTEKKLAQAKEQLARLKELMSRPETQSLVSQQEIETQALEVEGIQAELDQGKEVLEVSLAAAKSTLEQAEEAIRILDEQTLQSFDVRVELARQQWEMTIIKSPRKGVVLKTFLEPGELASTQPLLLMGDLTSMICVAEVFQSSMRFVEPGQKVTLSSPALDSPLQGVVSRIDRLVGESSLKNPNPLSPKDRKTADVYIVLDQGANEIARNFVNSQVTVEIAVTNSESSDAE